MHFPYAIRLRLMEIASSKRSPCAWDFLIRSEPARSTRNRQELVIVFELITRTMKIAWDLEENGFM